MRTLIATDKPLTISTVAEEIDFTNKCEVEHFNSLARWAQLQGLDGTPILIGQDTVFWSEWLQHRPNVQQRLVEHRFADWKEPESRIEYSLDGRPGTVKLHLTDEGGDGFIRLIADGYVLMGFDRGMYYRCTGVPSVAEVEEDMSKIKERREGSPKFVIQGVESRRISSEEQEFEPFDLRMETWNELRLLFNVLHVPGNSTEARIARTLWIRLHRAREMPGSRE